MNTTIQYRELIQKLQEQSQSYLKVSDSEFSIMIGRVNIRNLFSAINASIFEQNQYKSLMKKRTF